MMSQKGATLAITLLLLLVITLLGVSAIQVTQMQEKMTANLQDKEFSFFAAESVLVTGENYILALSKQPTSYISCSTYPCVQDFYRNTNFTLQDNAWWQSHSASYTNQLNNIATAPRYILEFIQFVPDTPVIGNTFASSTGAYYYRVTARATGSTNEAVTVLQSTIARRF